MRGRGSPCRDGNGKKILEPEQGIFLPARTGMGDQFSMDNSLLPSLYPFLHGTIVFSYNIIALIPNISNIIYIVFG